MKREILDHGYLELVERWGSDESIICAARMSTGKGFLGWGPKTNCAKCKVVPMVGDDEHQPADWCTPWGATPEQAACSHEWQNSPGDEKLLKYLYEHKHATPFEMAGMVIEVKAPIMVFREWHRHRTQSYNEMSARYVPLPDENYVPTVERLMLNSKTNKQAGTVKDTAELTEENAKNVQSAMLRFYGEAQRNYEMFLESGVPKELARICLPVGRYSRMRASANLRNWLAFLTLRMDAAAQWEIRQYANAVGELVAEKFPRTWELFAEGRQP